MFPQAQKRLSAKRLAVLGEEVEARRSELLEGREEGEEAEREDVREQDREDREDLEQRA